MPFPSDPDDSLYTLTKITTETTTFPLPNPYTVVGAGMVAGDRGCVLHASDAGIPAPGGYPQWYTVARSFRFDETDTYVAGSDLTLFSGTELVIINGTAGAFGSGVAGHYTPLAPADDTYFVALAYEMDAGGGVLEKIHVHAATINTDLTFTTLTNVTFTSPSAGGWTSPYSFWDETGEILTVHWINNTGPGLSSPFIEEIVQYHLPGGVYTGAPLSVTEVDFAAVSTNGGLGRVVRLSASTDAVSWFDFDDVVDQPGVVDRGSGVLTSMTGTGSSYFLASGGLASAHAAHIPSVIEYDITDGGVCTLNSGPVEISTGVDSLWALVLGMTRRNSGDGRTAIAVPADTSSLFTATSFDNDVVGMVEDVFGLQIARWGRHEVTASGPSLAVGRPSDGRLVTFARGATLDQVELTLWSFEEMAPPFWRNLAINPSGEQSYNRAWIGSNGIVNTSVTWEV